MELIWYIKFSMNRPAAMLKDTKDALNNEFKKPKSQAQYVMKVHEIKQRVNEFEWGFDQILKCVLQ